MRRNSKVILPVRDSDLYSVYVAENDLVSCLMTHDLRRGEIQRHRRLRPAQDMYNLVIANRLKGGAAIQGNLLYSLLFWIATSVRSHLLAMTKSVKYRTS